MGNRILPDGKGKIPRAEPRKTNNLCRVPRYHGLKTFHVLTHGVCDYRDLVVLHLQETTKIAILQSNFDRFPILQNMKQLFFLLLTLSFAAGAQDSCKLKKARDPYTKEVRLSTGTITIGSHKVTIDANSKEIDIFFILSSTAEGNCFNDASTVTVNYAGSRLKTSFRNTGTMNCEGYFHITFRNTPSTNYNLQKLATQKVGTLAFSSGKVTTTIAVNEEQQAILQKAIACIASEAKTLLPSN